MNSPEVGFRRAKATSWTLAGVGIAGVVTASLLAYADTAEKADAEAGPDSVVALPAAPAASRPDASTTTSVAPSYSPQIHTRSHGS